MMIVCTLDRVHGWFSEPVHHRRERAARASSPLRSAPRRSTRGCAACVQAQHHRGVDVALSIRGAARCAHRAFGRTFGT